MSYKKKNFSPHGESDLKESWYWNVLLKNMGTWQRARQAVHESRDRVDPVYNLAGKNG